MPLHNIALLQQKKKELHHINLNIHAPPVGGGIVGQAPTVGNALRHFDRCYLQD
jgi:hypothetical protein